MEVAGEDAGGLPGQGGVHADLKVGGVGGQVLLFNLPDKVEQLLGAAHGKGGNHHVAPAAQGAVDDVRQLLFVLPIALVEPVAVGALREDVVCLLDVLGIPDNGLVVVADVAGKDDLPGLAPLGKPDFRTGGAQQMPGVGETKAGGAGKDVQLLAVLAGDQLLQGQLRILHSVQRLHRRAAGPLALLVLPLGVALLDVGRVPQHDGQQLGGEPGAVDGTVKALLDQQRQAAGVVNVSVGHHNGVDIPGRKVQTAVVLLVPPLLKSAVHQNPLSAALHAVTAAGDRLGRAEKGQFHTRHLLFMLLSSL